MELLLASDGSLIRRSRRLRATGFSFVAADGMGEGYATSNTTSVEAEIMGLLAAMRFAASTVKSDSRYDRVRIQVDCEQLVRIFKDPQTFLPFALMRFYRKYADSLRARCDWRVEKCRAHAAPSLNSRAHDLAYRSARREFANISKGGGRHERDISHAFEHARREFSIRPSDVPEKLGTLDVEGEQMTHQHMLQILEKAGYQRADREGVTSFVKLLALPSAEETRIQPAIAIVAAVSPTFDIQDDRDGFFVEYDAETQYSAESIFVDDLSNAIALADRLFEQKTAPAAVLAVPA